MTLTRARNILRRVIYLFLLIASLMLVAAAGRSYVHDVRLSRAATAYGLLELTKVFIGLFAAGLTISFLLRDRRSHPKAPEAASGVPGRRAVRSLDEMRRFPEVIAGTARHPILASLVALLVFAIPIGLRAMGTPGGLEGFGPRDWILVSAAELPIVCLALLVIVRLKGR